MAGIITCNYCSYWQKSPIQKLINATNEDTKKKKKKKEEVIEYKSCGLNNRKIKGTTAACKYFKPRLYFYCHTYRYWLSIYQCLSRRRNREFYYKPNRKIIERNKLYMYPDCTAHCQQFRDDILPICKHLNINRMGKIKRPKPRKIKRRATKRTIKRRQK